MCSCTGRSTDMWQVRPTFGQEQTVFLLSQRGKQNRVVKAYLSKLQWMDAAFVPWIKRVSLYTVSAAILKSSLPTGVNFCLVGSLQ